MLPQVGQSFGKFMFYHLSDEFKLETGLMVLANLSGFINRRPDLQRLVSSFLVSHCNQILAITSHLVILRIMRAIAYYPSTMYFLYIETQMARGKIFILEGIKSFERIIKTNKYSELLELLSKIIINLMNSVRVSDPIMQLIVLNNY
jgi:hypothetical protein